MVSLPPPVTTLAWRLAYLIVGVFGMRTANSIKTALSRGRLASADLFS